MTLHKEQTIHIILQEMFQMQQKSKAFMDILTGEETLSQHQVMLLIQLKLYGKMKITDIASAFHVSPGAATSMCDKLENLELVTRIREPEDRRVVKVDLTENGEQKITEIFKKFPPNQLNKIADVFKEVNRLMSKIL
ncbi:MarR family transcriptional regulator [Bacillus sp. HMF5848]|uniref:MarR family winged helix-turn-helix transcriptional regulator n=1 Tax=Bacillus sp. HMF5848 TaxID=2495421 RepID=UPI000F777951|nr:MarR family transcriptional regulator [Bacillus sp. HMF5848]RSK27191.1 MarR family transcriptional regulator [Bacillus sp. HMF5848]